MKSRIKKTALFMVMVGAALVGLSGYVMLDYFFVQHLTLDAIVWGNFWMGLSMSFVLGLAFLIPGSVWMARYSRRPDEIARLKRYGKKVHARYIKETVTTHKINNRKGTVISLQEENGSQIFHSKPIFSELSIRWLEEHIFDVYVDTKNPEKYYVDMEKHFGSPRKL